MAKSEQDDVAQQHRPCRDTSRATQSCSSGIDERRVEVIADLIVDRADERSTLQPGQRFQLFTRTGAGVSKLDLAVGHFLAAQPKRHVGPAVGRPREHHRQIPPQQPLQFVQALKRRPGDQAAVFLFEVGRITGHQQHNPPALAGTPGADDAKVVTKRRIEHQGLRLGRFPDLWPDLNRRRWGCCFLRHKPV